MEKLDMQTKNLADEKFEALKQLFPNAVTETKGDDGEVVRAVDKDVLMQEIATQVVEGRDERYQFTWPDKRQAILAANAPLSKTLRPAREESVNFDNTENLYIEGDNLDVLKLLQETYLGKIKMIYIDPPYNTGSDFVYKDDFKQSAKEYIEASGQYDEEGNRLEKNMETNGRFHTDWLNMIYPRLKLARNLLSDDGVIFISIDDNEQANLKKVCDEIFGEGNFIGKFNWTRKKKGAFLNKKFRIMTENILLYQKQDFRAAFYGEKAYSDKKQPIVKRTNSQKELFFPADTVFTTLTDGKYGPIEGEGPTDITFLNEFEVKDGKVISEIFSEAKYVWTQEFLDKEISSGTEIYLSNKFGFNVLRSNQKNKIKAPSDVIDSKVNVGTNEDGSAEIADLFKTEVGTIFDYSKPTSLIKYLCKMITYDEKDDSIILDFFSGSATTAHAVMDLNAEDGGNRKYIMVQLPEETDEKSEAYKAGYKTICDIGKERIRRAGQKILEEHKDKESIEDLDIGFRVLKIDSSNMKDVYYEPDMTEQGFLDSLENNIKEDRSPEDLLFQVMLDLGIPLSADIQVETVGSKDVYVVEGGFFIACFDAHVGDEVVKAIAEKKPYYAVFRDASMASDSVATNFDQIFESISPETVRRVL